MGGKSSCQPPNTKPWRNACANCGRGKGSDGSFCGGGPRLFRALLDARLVDDLRLLVRPRIDGRRGAATLSGVPGEFFPASIHLRLLKMEVRGGECLLHYRVRRTPAKPPLVA